MKRFRLFFLSVLADIILAAGVVAQATMPASGLPVVDTHQAFLDLTNDGVVMNISAHPDDEDGATLAYYRMKYGVRTYSILFTRGEGGQNETGPELYEELGVLRTGETMAAGKVLGAEVHFLNFKDFGYSKTATETFRKWGGQQEVLRRLVLAIRKYKPDVIFTNHSTVEGHGHHQVVAIASIAAFDAAADPAMFPEQLKLNGLALWQPRKLFFRNFGRTNQTADVVNAIGDTNAVRGKSYLDIAADALTMHKTQGMDRADLRRFTRGMSLYRLMRSNSMYERDTTSFFGGINLWSDQSGTGLQEIRTVTAHIHPQSTAGVVLDEAADVLKMIASARSARQDAFVSRMLDQWNDEVERIVQLSCNVSGTITLDDTVIVPNQKVLATVRLSSPSCTVSDVRLSFSLPDGWNVAEQSEASGPASKSEIAKKFEFRVEQNPVFSLPRTVAQYTPIEHVEEMSVRAGLTLDGRSVSLTLHPAFDVAPPLVLSVRPSVVRISPSGVREAKKFTFSIKNYLRNKTAGRVTVEAPKAWISETVSFVVPGEDSTATGSISVKPPVDVKPGEYPLRFRAGGAFEDVTVRVLDWNVDRDIRLGIIRSYDNTLEAAAGELGMKYRLLEGKDLENDLSQFTTIVVDIRAYLVREDLKKNNQKVLDYVKRGGNLVVMYQKDQDWKPEYAPYPFTVTRKRVSVEEAPVRVLHPAHPLFNLPNAITDGDWSDWKQERGVYFPDDVAPQYTQLLSSNDPDEPPLTTGYLFANYGSGSYIYTSYVWYRQLKEYNAGAWRNFINMICYPNYRKSTTP